MQSYQRAARRPMRILVQFTNCGHRFLRQRRGPARLRAASPRRCPRRQSRAPTSSRALPGCQGAASLQDSTVRARPRHSQACRVRPPSLHHARQTFPAAPGRRRLTRLLQTWSFDSGQRSFRRGGSSVVFEHGRYQAELARLEAAAEQERTAAAAATAAIRPHGAVRPVVLAPQSIARDGLG